MTAATGLLFKGAGVAVTTGLVVAVLLMERLLLDIGIPF
jgi:hypothetical protein